MANNNLHNKNSHEKHNKYLDFYNSLKKNDNEYWGIGIENELDLDV
jgi:hypothetical protein